MYIHGHVLLATLFKNSVDDDEVLPPWAAAWSAKLGMAVAVNAGSSEGGMFGALRVQGLLRVVRSVVFHEVLGISRCSGPDLGVF